METLKFMLCGLNYSNNHVEIILIPVKNIEQLFWMVSVLLSDLISDLLFLFSDGSQVNEYKVLYLQGCLIKPKQSTKCLTFLMSQSFSCI